MADHTQYFTYILQCSDGTYYTGKTTDLEKRLRQHNGEISGGAKYTRIRRPVTLKYFEPHLSNKEAMQRENQIKLYPRKKKRLLCIDFPSLNKFA